MRHTDHMTKRMQQRALPANAIALTLDLGEWNERGDRLQVGRGELDVYIRELRRVLKDAERLRRRHGATVVIDGEVLITAYDGSRGDRA